MGPWSGLERCPRSNCSATRGEATNRPSNCWSRSMEASNGRARGLSEPRSRSRPRLLRFARRRCAGDASRDERRRRDAALQSRGHLRARLPARAPTSRGREHAPVPTGHRGAGSWNTGSPCPNAVSHEPRATRPRSASVGLNGEPIPGAPLDDLLLEPPERGREQHRESRAGDPGHHEPAQRTRPKRPPEAGGPRPVLPGGDHHMHGSFRTILP